MTNTQHTPGPWRVQDGMIQSQSKWSDDTGDHFDWAYPRILADVVEDWDQPANARLIAAAPELLAALQALLPYVAGTDSFAAEEALARAAIAKATGK